MDGQDWLQPATIALIARLIAGAIGGGAAGTMLPAFSLGRFGNAVAGIVGGSAGVPLFLALGFLQPGGTETEMIGLQAIGGAIGGALLLILIGLFRGMSRR